MHSSSRESLLALQKSFDEKITDVAEGDLDALGDDLASVTELLGSQAVLRKHLATRADDSKAKVALVDSLLNGKIGSVALDLVRSAVSLRWSSTRDLIEALERLSRLVVLVEAEKAGKIETVEDELFRFGRTLDANSRLSSLLSDVVRPVDGRIELLTGVLGGKTTEYTTRLLTQSVRLLRGRALDAVVPELADLAAARRGESVANVVAAAPLSDAQTTRLTEVLSKVVGRQISVQLHVDPEIIGGLEITVGNEVIDGTIKSRLVSATTQLPK